MTVSAKRAQNGNTPLKPSHQGWEWTSCSLQALKIKIKSWNFLCSLDATSLGVFLCLPFKNHQEKLRARKPQLFLLGMTAWRSACSFWKDLEGASSSGEWWGNRTTCRLVIKEGRTKKGQLINPGAGEFSHHKKEMIITWCDRGVR